MKRIYLSTTDNGKENDDKAPCQCSLEILKQFDSKFSEMNAKFSEITGEIKELKEIIQTQNETIMAALSTQKVVTESLVRQEKNNVAIKSVFPINTFEELKALNDAIIEENRQIYTNAMKLSLKGKLPKTLTTILSLQLILAINIDGTHGKKRLKDYEKVFDALMDAIRPLCEDPDKELRNALAVIKKRHFHNVCVEKKK
ncbi:hypothetical protein FF38_04654 [Lucilia cuprina]|uniref:DUF4806 domain-containing protein n=1 Tax=Lucilia cuprina TaxID=7375 RepID=A0A0L0BR00_LUCCU|nr:hypothetical protein FF38_04654 [Lucilia cuprina]